MQPKGGSLTCRASVCEQGVDDPNKLKYEFLWNKIWNQRGKVDEPQWGAGINQQKARSMQQVRQCAFAKIRQCWYKPTYFLVTDDPLEFKLVALGLA